MYLDPLDIACYVYCPLLQKKKRYDKIVKPLTVVERNIRQSIINAERTACLKDNIVAPRKLLSAWEQIWWPAATKAKIPMKEANKISLSAAHKFADYCKYDISDWVFPTAAVEVESDIKIGQSILKASSDIVKVDLNQSKNTVLINMNRKGLSIRSAAFDPAIKATAYAFYSGKGETITHITIDLDQSLSDLRLITSTFRPKAIEEIRKMLYHVECGIRYGIHNQNPYSCERCGVCQDFI